MISGNFGGTDSLETTKVGVKIIPTISPTTTFETANSQ